MSEQIKQGDNYYITVKGAGNVTTTTGFDDYNYKTGTVKADRPWMNYYLTPEKFAEIVRVEFMNNTFRPEEVQHPEDLYYAFDNALKAVAGTLVSMVQVSRGDAPTGLEE
jgi:hypothetical protein